MYAENSIYALLGFGENAAEGSRQTCEQLLDIDNRETD